MVSMLFAKIGFNLSFRGTITIIQLIYNNSLYSHIQIIKHLQLNISNIQLKTDSIQYNILIYICLYSTMQHLHIHIYLHTLSHYHDRNTNVVQ